MERNAAWREWHVPPWCFPWRDEIADPVGDERTARLAAIRQDVLARVARGEDMDVLAQYVDSQLSAIGRDGKRVAESVETQIPASRRKRERRRTADLRSRLR